MYYLHYQAILRRNPNLNNFDISHWWNPTGLRFILQSCVMNTFLRPLFNWLIAIYFPVALVGLIGWPGEIGIRLILSAAIYIAAFSFVVAGEYWGYFYSPLLVLGAVRAPAALRDLGRAAFGTRTLPESSERPRGTETGKKS